MARLSDHMTHEVHALLDKAAECNLASLQDHAASVADFTRHVRKMEDLLFRLINLDEVTPDEIERVLEYKVYGL